MLPQPIRPRMTGFMASSLQPAEEGLAIAREAHWVVGLVVLGDQPLRAGVAACARKRGPVERARADVGPAVLVELLARGCQIFRVQRNDPPGLALHPEQRVGAAARQP